MQGKLNKLVQKPMHTQRKGGTMGKNYNFRVAKIKITILEFTNDVTLSLSNIRFECDHFSNGFLGTVGAGRNSVLTLVERNWLS